MINPVQTTIPQADGSDRQVTIAPEIKNNDQNGLQPTGVFEIYEARAWTDPDAAEDQAEEPEAYLGALVFVDGRIHHFKGAGLSLAEQAYLAVMIETYGEPDI